MSFPIDPGTVPPLTGPGVVAGRYELTPSQIDSTRYLRLWDADADTTAEPAVLLTIDRNGDVWVASVKVQTEALSIALDRLRRRLDGFGTAYRARTFPEALTEPTLRTWLRELNIHPTSAHEAQETP